MRKIALSVYVLAFLFAVVAATAAPDQKPDEQPLDACSLLDNPQVRNIMSGAFEIKLLSTCGRQDELGQIPSVPSTPLAPSAMGTNVLVNNPTAEQPRASGFTESETTLARNSDSTVICSAYNDSYSGVVLGTGYSGFSSSADSGVTWVDRGVMTAGAGGVAYGDPSNVWSKRDGKYYHASLVLGGLGLWSLGASCSTATWVNTIHAGDNDDKELMTVDNEPSSPYYGRLYVAWTNFTNGHIYITTSDNSGGTWSAPVDISGHDSVQGAWPAVDPVTNDVYAAWVHWDSYPAGPIDIEVVRSTTGGATWGYVTNPATDKTNPRDPTATSSCGRPALKGNIRYLPSPQIAVDARGNLHVVYSYDPDGYGVGDVVNVYYRRSTDQGATWGTEVRLNDDATLNDQWFPALAVSPNGSIAAFWYDRRDDPGNVLYYYYGAVSNNNGVTFNPNVRVSDVQSGVVLDPSLATCYHGDYDTSIADNTLFYIQWADDRPAGPVPQADPNVWSDTANVPSPGAIQSILWLLLLQE